MSLTDKQEKFVQELIKGKSQREAYKIAYPNSDKWADNAIDVNASKLFNNTKVQLRYNKIKDRLIKEAEDECIVSAKEVLRELKKVGFANINDFLSFKTAKSVIDRDDDGSPIIDYTHIIELKDSDDIDGSVISEVQLKDGQLKFKLHDKMKALENIGRHLGMFTDKVEHSGEIDTEVTINIGNEDYET